MGSTPERLPSFKPPRDLSLSRGNKTNNTSGSAAGQQVARPKRVFTPNIPPKRDRAGPSSGTSASAPSTSSAAPKENPRGRGGRGGRGRGANAGRGRPRPELQQAESIFSGGIGDALESKRSSALQYKGGFDRGRYGRSSGGEGRTKLSNLNRNTLTTLIKEENDETNEKIFGSEKFESEVLEDANSENPNAPVVLPLLSYIPHLFAPPFSLEPKPTDETESKSGPDHTSIEVDLSKVKQELLDDDEVASTSTKPPPSSTTVQIKQEKDDENDEDAALAEKLKALSVLSLEPTSFAGTFRSVLNDDTEEGTLAIFQFPDQLPVLKGSLTEPDQPNASERKNASELVDNASDVPEGVMGKLQILSSGRTRLVLGDIVFDVDAGRQVGFLQELYSMDPDKKTFTNLGKIDRKFLITPDIEHLVSDSP